MADHSAFTAPSLEPAKSRPPRWAIWLPAGLTAALLLVIVAAFVSLGQRIAQEHQRLADVLEPTNRELIQLRLTFTREAALIRSYAALPREDTRTRYRLAQQQSTESLAALQRLAPHISPGFARDLAELKDFVARKRAYSRDFAEGRISLEDFRQQLPQQDSLGGVVLAAAADLDTHVSTAIRQQLTSVRRLERLRLSILSTLLPLALLSAILTAWYGEKARSLNQRLARRAAEEALVRDAMAALTGAEVVPDALNRIASIAMRVGEADGAYIEQSDDARNVVEVVAIAGDVAPPLGTQAPYVDSATDEVVRAGRPDVITDLTTHGAEIGRQIMARCELCAGLAVPLHHNGDVEGALVLIHRHPQGTVPANELVGRIWILGALAGLALRRRRMSTELEAERRRLDAVVAEMPAGVVLAEAPSGRIVLTNREAVSIWPTPESPAESAEEYGEFSKAFHLDGRPYRPEDWPLTRSLRTGEVVQGEEAAVDRGDGTRAYIRFSSAPIRDLRGSIIAAVLTMYDISEQKQREQANQFLDEVGRVLTASLDYEATLKALLQLSVPRLADIAVLHMRVDRDKAIRRFESIPADTKSREVLETIDRNYAVRLGGPHPSAVAIRTGQPQLRAEVTDETLREMSEDEENLRLLRMLNIRSGMAAPLTVRGKTLGALMLASQDPVRRYTQSDLALAEEFARRAALAVDNAELFRTVSENEKGARFLADAAQGVSGSLDYQETLRRVARMGVPFFADFTIAFLTNAQGTTQHVEVAHRDPEAERSLEALTALHRAGPKKLASMIIRAMRAGRPVLVDEVTPDLLDSLEFEPDMRELYDQLAPVCWLTVPLEVGETKLGAIVFARVGSRRLYRPKDVSFGQLFGSRAALALQNAMLYREVQEALSTRDEVLAIVSHDLRNPLHTIGMSAELLLEKPCDAAEQRRYVEMISQASQRMERLIHDLLDVARIGAGKSLSIEPRAEPPKELIREACEAFTVLAREKDIRLEYSVPDELPDVIADHGRILQVLSNLISNALRYTPDAGRVEVRAQLDRDMVRVSVRDTGPGIRHEDRQKIFLPFWQAKRVARKGAGLGLTIARAIIEEHGGHIWVESEPGAGSTFHFTLPVNRRGQESRAA